MKCCILLLPTLVSWLERIGIFDFYPYVIKGYEFNFIEVMYLCTIIIITYLISYNFLLLENIKQWIYVLKFKVLETMYAYRKTN